MRNRTERVRWAWIGVLACLLALVLANCPRSICHLCYRGAAYAPVSTIELLTINNGQSYPLWQNDLDGYALFWGFGRPEESHGTFTQTEAGGHLELEAAGAPSAYALRRWYDDVCRQKLADSGTLLDCILYDRVTEDLLPLDVSTTAQFGSYLVSVERDGNKVTVEIYCRQKGVGLNEHRQTNGG